MLNRRKAGNYAFFCPASQLHLTISNPIDYANRVTSYILRGLKSGVILDTKGVIDLEAGVVKETLPVAEIVTETIPAPKVVADSKEELTESADTEEVAKIPEVTEEKPVAKKESNPVVKKEAAKKGNKKAASK